MKHSVRTVIRLIASGIMVIGALNLGLEFARFRRHRADFSLWHCVLDFLLLVLGAALFATSSKLAELLTKDLDE